ncbi:MAG: ABC transporter ATP-binding protein [Chloroflexi bacterium]|nr:ABC transporter ATP-binding protein [Chloroflexota bacterium]
MNLLIQYLKPHWRRVLALSLLLLGSIALQLLNPQILRYFIDAATSGSTQDVLIRTGLLFLGVTVVTQVVSVAETYVAENVGLTITNQLRADLTLHCLHLDLSFYKDHAPGELIERVDGDVSNLSNLFSRFIVYMIGNAILLLCVLILFFTIDLRVGLGMVAFAIFALVVLNGLRYIPVPYWKVARQASANFFGFLEERLAGTEDIRANGGIPYVLYRLTEHSRALLYKQTKAAVVGGITRAATFMFLALGMVVALSLGAYFYGSGVITIGTVYLIFSYTELLNRPIDQFSRQIQDLQQASASLARIRNLFLVRGTILDGTGTPLPAGALPVAFENVTFAYDGEGAVVQNLTFHLEAGKHLGLLGRTGSGKTTVVRLLFRLYDPSAGVIRLGGADLRTLPLADLRRRVGMVTQDIQLFHATVRDNLTLFDRSLSDDRIMQALQELGLWEWFQRLPEGLETKLERGGNSLSAGEAQLLAFVRVFLKDPSLVILDEASSRLDPTTEKLIEHAVQRLLANRTAIIIAHRLATVNHVDAIIILEDGKCCEYGLRAQLAHDPDSRFTHLLRTGLNNT